ncbi:hypothetical protein B484DRAFT_104395 [Ochromonadaceae sp. CCMP2298]|nr:hypothetical protein B484DRAFT_104395 [Ochromonadaceae sp. CCMP2298]
MLTGLFLLKPVVYGLSISDTSQCELLNDILNQILVNTEMSETQNKSNGDHSILFESINLVISYGAGRLNDIIYVFFVFLSVFLSSHDQICSANLQHFSFLF